MKKTLMDYPIRRFPKELGGEALRYGDELFETALQTDFSTIPSTELMSYARNALKKMNKDYLVALVDDDQLPDSDVRHCLLMNPSYVTVAVCVVLYVRQDFDLWDLEGIEGDFMLLCRRAFRCGISAHGYDAPETRQKIRDMLLRCGALEFLKNYGERFPEFMETVGLVWYGAYGSNISAKRFLSYIQGGRCEANGQYHKGCRDRTKWHRSEVCMMPGILYFGGYSRFWDGGVAYYERSESGTVWMRLYMITIQQLEDVARQEGRGYKTVELQEHKGVPVYTLEAAGEHSASTPSDSYRELILSALIRECKMTDEAAHRYIRAVEDYTQYRASMEEIIRRRQITALYHFTPLENLPDILENGLLSRNQMEKKGIQAFIPDSDRLDGCLDYISLSIGHPNYKMFYVKRNEDTRRIWLVLELDPKLLLDHSCRFHQTNAAKAGEQDISIELLESAEGLERLFDSKVGSVERSDEINLCDPTDPQAEILVKGSISKEYFQAIWIESGEIYDELPPEADDFSIQADDRQNDKKHRLFGPRADWQLWRKNN